MVSSLTLPRNVRTRLPWIGARFPPWPLMAQCILSRLPWTVHLMLARSSLLRLLHLNG